MDPFFNPISANTLIISFNLEDFLKVVYPNTVTQWDGCKQVYMKNEPLPNTTLTESIHHFHNKRENLKLEG